MRRWRIHYFQDEPLKLKIILSGEPVTENPIGPIEGPDEIDWGESESGFLSDGHSSHIYKDGTVADYQEERLVRDLFAVPGVAKLELKRYEIIIHRSQLFSWRDMILGILTAIEFALEPLGEFECAGPPTCSYRDEYGRERERIVRSDGSPLGSNPN